MYADTSCSSIINTHGLHRRLSAWSFCKVHQLLVTCRLASLLVSLRVALAGDTMRKSTHSCPEKPQCCVCFCSYCIENWHVESLWEFVLHNEHRGSFCYTFLFFKASDVINTWKGSCCCDQKGSDLPPSNCCKPLTQLFYFVRVFWLGFFFLFLARYPYVLSVSLFAALARERPGSHLQKHGAVSAESCPAVLPLLRQKKERESEKKRNSASSLMWRRCRGAAGVRCPSSFFLFPLFFHSNPRQSSWHQSRVGINERSPVGVKWFCHSRRRLSTRLADAQRVLMRLFRSMRGVEEKVHRVQTFFKHSGADWNHSYFVNAAPVTVSCACETLVRQWHLPTFSAGLVATFCSLANRQ